MVVLIQIGIITDPKSKRQCSKRCLFSWLIFRQKHPIKRKRRQMLSTSCRQTDTVFGTVVSASVKMKIPELSIISTCIVILSIKTFPYRLVVAMLNKMTIKFRSACQQREPANRHHRGILLSRQSSTPLTTGNNLSRICPIRLRDMGVREEGKPCDASHWRKRETKYPALWLLVV